MKLRLTRRQWQFLQAGADEVLFGGAAGGGKSHAQLADALVYALRWPGSKQLILRRSYPDLERSLILAHLEFYPRAFYRYSSTAHRGVFANGSRIEFGFCAEEKDVYRYQGAEYDTIRFDELTQFTESMYRYLLSRLRGPNDFPKQVKSTANPGGLGHAWVKSRFIDPAPPDTVWQAEAGSRVFLPSLARDNCFLLQKDPGYLRRLKNLDEGRRRALLEGDWDLTEGQFFPEFKRETHVCAPFPLPRHWRRYRTLDYGTDMLACYWVAVDEAGRGYVYRELYEGRDNGKGEGGKGHIISAAARRILEAGRGEEVCMTLAPPDLWNRRQETGRSAADLFFEEGVPLVKTGNERVNGWRAVREWLAPQKEEDGALRPRLRVFEGCVNLIRALGALQRDEANCEDAAHTPHELTHAPDALRGFCSYWVEKAPRPARAKARWSRDMYEDYQRACPRDRDYLLARWGNPF